MLSENEYKLLKVFPSDKSPAPLHKYSAQYSKIEFKGVLFTHVVARLVRIKFLENEGNNYAITDDGLKAIKEYENHFDRQNEVADLTYKKLQLDTKISERVYKSYPLTRALAWIGAISGAIALILKLLELFGILPKSK